MKRALGLLGLLLIYSALGCGPVKPPKPPVPSPTPTPQGMPLLKAVGNQFVPPILGSVTTHHGWPLVDAGALDSIAAAGLNYTAMRVPCEIDDRPGYDVYVRATPTQVDLTKFNPAYDALEQATLQHALDRKIYVNKGLWDGWCAVHISTLNSPYKASGNVNSVDIGSCADFGGAPHPVILALVRHEVQILGKFPNVIWELGNEANRCKPASAFIDGVRDAVRAEEAARGFPRHLWSPGTFESGALGSEFDFVSEHNTLVAVGGVPVEVNEFAPQGQALYLSNLAKYKSIGPFHLWHDDPPDKRTWDDPTWEAEWLSTMKLMTSTPATTGCTNIPDQNAVAVVPRPPADPIISNAINSAIQRVMPGCAVNSECAIAEPMQSFFTKVTEEIRRGAPGSPPICAGVQSDTEGLVDQICAGTSQRCQGAHIYTCDAGCATGKVGWMPGAYTKRNADTWVLP